jgi:hypothetical protein
MAKYGAYETLFEIGDGATPTEGFTTLAYVTALSGPGLSLDVEDVTSHDQATAWEEVVPTILRSGEVSIDLVFDPADNTQDFTEALAMGSLMEARGTATNFRITFPNHATHTKWLFAANVTGWEPSAPVDGALTLAAKVKITGLPTLV